MIVLLLVKSKPKLDDPTTPKGLKEDIVEFPLSAKNSIAGLINSLEDALNLNDDF